MGTSYLCGFGTVFPAYSTIKSKTIPFFSIEIRCCPCVHQILSTQSVWSEAYKHVSYIVFSIVKIWKNHKHFLCSQTVLYKTFLWKNVLFKRQEEHRLLIHLNWETQPSQKCPRFWKDLAQDCPPFSWPLGICVQGCNKLSPWHFSVFASETWCFSQQHLAWANPGLLQKAALWSIQEGTHTHASICGTKHRLSSP